MPEKHREESAFAFINNRFFGADVLFIRTEKTVGAQGAQCLHIPADRRAQMLRVGTR
jgi:hypothetical protein